MAKPIRTDAFWGLLSEVMMKKHPVVNAKITVLNGLVCAKAACQDVL